MTGIVRNKEELPLVTADELLSLGAALRACNLEIYTDQVLEILPFLTSEERFLLIDLVGRFSVCEFADYYSRGMNLSLQLVASLNENVKHVILLPLINPIGQVKPKSGEGIAWLMSREMEAKVKSSGRTFEMSSRTIRTAVLKRAEVTAFILVDDFVGSGATAENAIDWLSSQGVSPKNIVVGCFLGLESGVDKIVAKGASAVFLGTLGRGISDAAHISDKQAALQLMAGVEEKNGVVEKFRFGYRGGEALALMCFCPNNTFPIFWWDGPAWNGPFSR